MQYAIEMGNNFNFQVPKGSAETDLSLDRES